MSVSRGLALTVLPLVAVVASAQPPERAPGDDLDGKTWEQFKVSLPSYPAPNNLTRIYVGPTASFEFYVDSGSLSVAESDIVRYTLVARSASGAMNVSYEGIRCDSHERRSYAFGRFDGTWSQARNSQWVPISRAQANSQYETLATEYFCPRGSRVRTAAEAVLALKRGSGPGAGR
jgi:hypothetical protein